MKIGIISGSWDLCHPGHIMAFKECKDNCDYLIVALQVNPQIERKDKNRPVETILERYMRLDAIRYIDKIIPYETEYDYYLIMLYSKPDIRFLGSDWEGKGIVGSELPMEFYYLNRNHTLSSTNLRKRVKCTKS